MSEIVVLSIIIMGSVLLSLILGIVCVKRKFTRSRECMHREPHIPGEEARKSLKREVERKIDRVGEIYYEPRLLTLEDSSGNDRPPYYFRMKAVDNMKYLEQELTRLEGVTPRSPRENIRAFLLNLTSPGHILSSLEPRVIHELCDLYDHARHHSSPFLGDHFTLFHGLLIRILHSGRVGEKFGKQTVKTYAGKPPSEHDSAIDEPDNDHSGDDENLLICETNISLLHRQNVAMKQQKPDFETCV